MVRAMIHLKKGGMLRGLRINISLTDKGSGGNGNPGACTFWVGMVCTHSGNTIFWVNRLIFSLAGNVAILDVVRSWF